MKAKWRLGVFLVFALPVVWCAAGFYSIREVRRSSAWMPGAFALETAQAIRSDRGQPLFGGRCRVGAMVGWAERRIDCPELGALVRARLYSLPGSDLEDAMICVESEVFPAGYCAFRDGRTVSR